MSARAHKATLRDAFERLAARDAGGGSTQHGLASERERLLEESEDPAAARRWFVERLYHSRDLAGGYKVRGLKAVAVLVGVGGALVLLAWWMGGFGL
jgi:ferric-dicitrate binding protein FerR (iron transport regulator)